MRTFFCLRKLHRPQNQRQSTNESMTFLTLKLVANYLASFCYFTKSISYIIHLFCMKLYSQSYPNSVQT
ncbi:hypothetical protein HanPSC8_Chr09g0395991 [Helianthus annuus]|nr:hypothetical protein HanPSC8_Chr09g0395991 [Helianthus annuus]